MKVSRHICVFSRVARLATRLIGGMPAQQNIFITREELRVLLDLSESSANAATINRQRIRRIIRFGDTTVGEAMVPLAEVVGFEESKPMKEAIATVYGKGFNRLPVYRYNITNIHDVLTLNTWNLMTPGIEQGNAKDFTQTPLYLSPKQAIDHALPQLQARDDHMAIILDEFGSAIGILTMEDIFEEVVGEINVGYDIR